MSQQPIAAHLPYRRDIDGLRAIAVTAVVLYHAVSSWLPSGFVGVDIFFVISGYLIGGIVFKSAVERRFNFVVFYARRARRILPALFGVVVFSSLLSTVFLGVAEMLEFAGQCAMALVGASNFYFWQHTDYFATTSDHEPLLMTWSLGVEEQFYVLFPFLVILAARLRPVNRLISSATILAALFCLSVYFTASYPISAFYLLPARAWELGVGALLAIIHHDYPETSDSRGAWTQAIATLSLIGIVASVLVFDGNTPFPGFAGLLPVLCTAGLLQTRHSSINRILLSTGPLVFLGQISYSWYLWHWPLMAFARRAADFPPSALKMLVIAGVSLILGAASWRLIEQPFRKTNGAPSSTLLRYALLLCAVLAIPISLKLSHGWPSRLPMAVSITEASQREGRGSCLVPFGESGIITDSTCLPANAAIALLGDSHASALGPGLARSAANLGMRIAQLSKSSCLPLPGFARLEPLRPRHAQQCNEFQNAAVGRILSDPAIKIVVVAGLWPEQRDMDIYRTNGDPDVRISAFQALRSGLTRLVETFSRAGKQVVIVADVPKVDFSPPSHLIGQALSVRRAVGSALDGDKRPTSDTFALARSDRGTVVTGSYLRQLAKDLGVRFFDPKAQLCSNGQCRFASGPVPIYFDGQHLSAAGSRSINWNAVLR